MNILLVGSGGREHALLWAVTREAPSARCFAAPGNPGTAGLGTNLPVPATDLDGLVAAVEGNGIDLTIVGPEVPLALGLADRLRGRGHPVFGPSAAAARIEASKAYAKDLMQRAGVPTAGSRTFRRSAEAVAWVDRHPEPLVVKASGLAAGKGAVVCATRAEAAAAVRTMMHDHALGEAGDEVVIEEFMAGEELSVFALTDGRTVELLPAAQDHKRLQEGDRGPNTGGMGAYSPVSMAAGPLLDRVREEILLPTLDRLDRDGARFRGLLYAGLMIGPDGAPRVVEFNCRFGDPETQAIVPLVAGGLLASLEAVARGAAPTPVDARPLTYAVTTVLAARGYPDRPEKGAAITLPEDLPEAVHVFHAGTTLGADGVLRAAGGRVLNVTGTGSTFAAAQAASRDGAGRIRFDGKVFRRDIGWREAERRASSLASGVHPGTL